jgi:hypothetical protein
MAQCALLNTAKAAACTGDHSQPDGTKRLERGHWVLAAVMHVARMHS